MASKTSVPSVEFCPAGLRASGFHHRSLGINPWSLSVNHLSSGISPECRFFIPSSLCPAFQGSPCNEEQTGESS